MKCTFLLLVVSVLVQGLTTVIAQTWTQTSAAVNFDCLSIAMSADGCKLAAVTSGAHPIYSTDAGATWHANQSSPDAYLRIASSADGTKLVAPMLVSNSFSYPIGIFVSTDSGGTWTQTTAPPAYYWSAVASSGFGDKLAAAFYTTSGFPNSAGGLVYVSTNAGFSWSKGGSPTKSWSSLACSADGNKIIAAAAGDKIYVTTNFGTSWAATASSTDGWSSVAANVDGTRLIASGNATYVSTNSGGSWRLATPQTGVVASSADGVKLIVAGNAIYTSSNSGVTWTSNSVPGGWSCVASSADGSEQVVGSSTFYGEGIWINRSMPSPRLNIQRAASNLQLSWLVPSTNFAPQFKSELNAAWVSLTNTPSLNATNLQEQLTIAPSNNCGFFRLIAQ
jgi:hypothetical protein